MEMNTTDPVTSDVPVATGVRLSTLAYHIGVGTVLCLLTIFTIMGNLLVVIAVYTYRRLRSSSNLFIASLASADLLVGVTVMPFSLIFNVTERWLFGATFCRIWISLDIMCATASIMSLCLISFDRYKNITSPLHYSTSMRRWKALAYIACVWIVSFVISVVPIYMNWHALSGVQEDEDPDDCVFDPNAAYAIVSSCISFYIPCTILLVNYSIIFKHAKLHATAIRKETDRYAEEGSTKESRKVSVIVKDNKAAFTLGIILGVFIVCWLPFFVSNVLAALCKDCVPGSVFSFVSWLGHVSSCLNPIIYSALNKDFRNAFRRILCQLFIDGDFGSSASNLSVLSTPRPKQPDDEFDELSLGFFESLLPWSILWPHRKKKSVPAEAEESSSKEERIVTESTITSMHTIETMHLMDLLKHNVELERTCSEVHKTCSDMGSVFNTPFAPPGECIKHTESGTTSETSNASTQEISVTFRRALFGTQGENLPRTVSGDTRPTGSDTHTTPSTILEGTSPLCVAALDSRVHRESSLGAVDGWSGWLFENPMRASVPTFTPSVIFEGNISTRESATDAIVQETKL